MVSRFCGRNGGALVGIRAHALHRCHKAVGVVFGKHNAFQRVATHAAEQRIFLQLRAAHARDPFRVRELGRQILRFAQFQIERGATLRRDFRRNAAVEIVACRADADRVLTGV